MLSTEDRPDLQNETTQEIIDRVNREAWKDRRVLIIGVTGFVGSWLSEILSSPEIGARVYGLVRRQSNPNLVNIEHVLHRDNLSLLKGDLHDIGSILTAIRESEAEVVFHLAAQSFVPYSFASPMDTYVTNVIGTINVLEALRLASHEVVMHFAGSSEEYGLVLAGTEHYEEMLRKYGAILPPPQRDGEGKVVAETPVSETNPLRTVGTSPYGSSKRQAEDACRTYVSCYGSKVHLTRAFNHTGPRRGNEFVSSEITRQIAMGIKHGRKEVRLGNLSSIRDFNDVREIVLGYLLSIEKGVPGEVYNLACGRGTSIGDLLNLALNTAKQNFQLSEMSYRMDESRLRPTDLPILVGDATKARNDLGWQPVIPLERTILEMIEYNVARL